MHLVDFFLVALAALYILVVSEIVPVWYDGLLLRHDAVIGFVCKPRWKQVNHLGGKLSFQDYSIVLRWPFRSMLQLHVARYGEGDFLREHIDVAHGKLFRIQVILRNARRGGELLCDHFILNRRNFKIFEPAKYKHEVVKVEEGTRLVLNFGVWFAWRPQKYAPQRD